MHLSAVSCEVVLVGLSFHPQPSNALVLLVFGCDCFLRLGWACLNFARGSVRFVGHLFASFPGLGKHGCTSYTPDVPGYGAEHADLSENRSEQRTLLLLQKWYFMCSGVSCISWWTGTVRFVPAGRNSGLLPLADKLQGGFFFFLSFQNFISCAFS